VELPPSDDNVHDFFLDFLGVVICLDADLFETGAFYM
jgi:hypothetical protein